MYRILATVLLVVAGLSSGAPPVQIGSRSILRAIGGNGDGGADLPDAAVNLNVTTFDSVLGDTPAKFAVVEFFAHWCPACRNYKPHYEKVARLFNGPNAVHPGLILMTRVDCALKANTKLCDRFAVTHYPMLFWGLPSKFTTGSWESGKNKSEIKVIDDGRTSERLLNWINKQMGSSYGLDGKKYEHEHLHSNSSDPEQIARAVYDVEEATSSAFEIIVGHKMIKSGTRSSFLRFLLLLVAHHPSRRCRKGSAEILVNFDELYPSEVWMDIKEKTFAANGEGLQNFQICGKEVPRGYWIFCHGSKNDTRGFSCGLWVLMHSISVSVEDTESHVAFTTLCDFIHNFFVCEECRQHYYKMCSGVSTPFNKTQDFALWLWSTHNKVNERLMKQEASLGTGDPKFPKMIWPPKQLCPKCYLSSTSNSDGSSQINWDQDEVFKFLVSYYGKMLGMLYKDKDHLNNGGGVVRHISEEITTSTNAVVVPVGAALVIAVASCAFGALACFWRSRQKIRKTRRSWT